MQRIRNPNDEQLSAYFDGAEIFWDDGVPVIQRPANPIESAKGLAFTWYLGQIDEEAIAWPEDWPDLSDEALAGDTKLAVWEMLYKRRQQRRGQ